LSNRELSNSQGLGARPTPTTFTRGKVSLPHKKVGAKYFFFGPNVSVALAVHTESMKTGPKDGSVPVSWDWHCGKANTNILVAAHND
jgi:hypothetical protein